MGDGYEVDGEIEEEEARVSKDTDDLFDDSGGDPVMDAPPSKTSEPYVRITTAWLKRVLPLVDSAEQLAIVLWLFRWRKVCRSKEWFSVPAKALDEELGLSRFTRYRAFKHLEQAGGIVVSRVGKKAMRVKLLW